MTYASEFRKNAYKIFSAEIIPIAKKFESERIKILKNARLFSLAGGILTFFIVLSFFCNCNLTGVFSENFCVIDSNSLHPGTVNTALVYKYKKRF